MHAVKLPGPPAPHKLQASFECLISELLNLLDTPSHPEQINSNCLCGFGHVMKRGNLEYVTSTGRLEGKMKRDNAE